MQEAPYFMGIRFTRLRSGQLM